jgi:hypothetical protein
MMVWLLTVTGIYAALTASPHGRLVTGVAWGVWYDAGRVRLFLVPCVGVEYDWLERNNQIKIDEHRQLL